MFRRLGGAGGPAGNLVSSDPILHNAHSEAVANKPFNIPQFTVAETSCRPFTAERRPNQVRCPSWMRAVVRVFDHPYFATTGEDGEFKFKLKGLKDGTYTVQAWHEVYKDSEPQTIEVKDEKAANDVNFTFKSATK